MQNTAQTFTYTAQRGSYIATVSALLFIMIGEVGLIAVLLIRYLSIDVLKWALVFAFVALYNFIAAKLLAPLWTRHRLTSTHLILRFGLDVSASIPRDTIVEARPVRERVVLPMARYEQEQQRINIAFSEQGQVLLHLKSARTFRMGLRGTVTTEIILFNVDHRDELLSALLPDAHPPEAASQHNIIDTAPVDGALRASVHVGTPLVGVRGMGVRDGGDVRGMDVQRSGVRGGEGVQQSDDRGVAIRTEHLTRRFGDIIAVDGLNLAVRRGEIYGFLGANGAGKTTTMKMLAGLLQPQEGRAWIDGYDVWLEPLKAKAALGFVADHAWLYERLMGREYLAFLAQLRGISRHEADEHIAYLLGLLDLQERAGSACGTYSFGMKRKLALAGALVHRPPVLILDEPLNGLDPLSARHLKDLFLDLALTGTTIFLSTHDLATAESICHRVGIIARGRLIAEGSAEDLRHMASAPDLEGVFLALAAQEGARI
jgi:ABC-2 type transport system ATP-binding protein